MEWLASIDWWTIIFYVIGALFNITAVSVLRGRALEAGRAWANSGRWSVILVFAIAFGLQTLIAGDFSAFTDAESFVEFLRDVSAYTMATLGTHMAGKKYLAKRED